MLSAAELEGLLARLAEGLKGLYGERYQGLVLYGSYARGEADEGSDVDVLLLLEGPVDSWQEFRRVEPMVWPLSLEVDLLISIVPVDVEAYRKSRKPFLINARGEGMPVP